MKCFDCMDEAVEAAWQSGREETIIYPTDVADTIYEGVALCIDHLHDRVKAKNPNPKPSFLWWSEMKKITVRRSA